jgi:FkbM family methyltransferase
MGIYKRTGVRKIAIYVIDAITFIRSYGLKDGLSLFRGFTKKKGSGFRIRASFLQNLVFLRDNISDQAIFRQVFLEQQYKLDELLSLDAKRIIDAGANIGCASLYFSKIFPGAEIVAIEPENSNFQLLKRNTAGYKKIACKHAALWGKNEMVSIANPEAEAASFMVQQTAESSIEGFTVDYILNENDWDTVDIVKIDIEGAEKEVFAENCNWLSKTKVLIVELHDRYKTDCTKTFFRSLEGLSYDAYFQHENIFILFK